MMQKRRKLIAVLLVVCLLWSSVGVVDVKADSSKDELQDWTYDPNTKSDLDSYYYYIQKHQNAAHPDFQDDIKVTKFQLKEALIGGEPSGTSVYTDREGSAEGLYIGAKGEQITFSANVIKTGLYAIEMTYFPLKDSNAQIMFGIEIDGETPFIEANSCILSRVFKNKPIEKDEFNDDIRPKADQTPEWRTQFLYDQTGINGKLYFYLEAGRHNISMTFDGTPLLLESMRLKQEPSIISYEEYLSKHKQEGAVDTTKVLELTQAETYYKQSDSTLWPEYDRTNPLTQPFEYENKRINFGGGKQWARPGQWLSWEVNAPEDGFYNIGLKYKQGYLDGLFSSRKIYIDGEVPFEEMSEIRFNYTAQWQNQLLGDESGAFSIYLTEGKHVITMENVLGDMSATMSVLQTVIDNLNELYLSVVMITGTEPDTFRDYYLEKQLPNLPTDLRANAKLLHAEAQRFVDIVGSSGTETAFFEDIAFNLENYADNIVDLTYKERIVNLKNDISSLSAKLSTYQGQALDIDYIALVSADMKMPKTRLNVFEWLAFQWKSFIASFVDKYEENDDSSIRVWINTGNDQFEIIKSMITDIYTPQTGITVDLELVQGTLIEATMSGSGPDVAIGIVADTVVNLGMRGALTDLSQFEGYNEILSEYMPGSEIPFKLEGKAYGMPNTTGFNVMYIRTDIFDRMGLKPPKTWDDMYDVAQVLQRYNMSLGSAATFANLLYQNGGTYFNDELTEVRFDEDVAVDALNQHAEFFTKYGFPITYDFVSRFRTGEMPIGIASYAIYNNLKYSAPEISGLWEMYPMPGSVQEDGSVNFTQVDNTGIGVIMFEKTENKDDAWDFIKWWCQAEAQTRYANDLEAAMGVSARYSTANMETLRAQGWSKSELAILEEQISYLEFLPIVPGNYYVTRGLTNCTRGVIYDGENARELLTEWTIRINDEIHRKRMEFYQNN